jgi:hypothetical protein
MLIINCPADFLSEREYIIRFFFQFQLGVNYEIKTHNRLVYGITLPNGRELIINDCFFSSLNEGEGYLNRNNIPLKINFIYNDDFNAENIPVIFGGSRVFPENGDSLFLEADVFASAFFMLTRWEEYVHTVRDEHKRFPAIESLAYKHNFLHRPVVNEYTEFLWNLLIYLGYKGERKAREFRIIPTHDIDQIIYWDKTRKNGLLKNLIGDIILRKRPKLALGRLISYLKSISGNFDPGDTFEYLMRRAESIGSIARFYFIAGGETKLENKYSVYDEKIKSHIDSIKKYGHIIGIHPSYKAYNDYIILNQEVYDLTKITGLQIIEGRNHYLRFEIPITWQILEQAGIKIDSSMYYSEVPGFRCGICNEFPVFSILQRKKLDLIERPLIAMDTSYKTIHPEKVYSEIIKLKETVKKYNGDFVFLWHNSNIDTPDWGNYKRVFEEAFYGG